MKNTFAVRNRAILTASTFLHSIWIVVTQFDKCLTAPPNRFTSSSSSRIRYIQILNTNKYNLTPFRVAAVEALKQNIWELAFHMRITREQQEKMKFKNICVWKVIKKTQSLKSQPVFCVSNYVRFEWLAFKHAAHASATGDGAGERPKL